MVKASAKRREEPLGCCDVSYDVDGMSIQISATRFASGLLRKKNLSLQCESIRETLDYFSSPSPSFRRFDGWCLISGKRGHASASDWIEVKYEITRLEAEAAPPSFDHRSIP